jgi:hypothetical protein
MEQCLKVLGCGAEGNVIGQATAAMFVRVELRDLCGREARAGEGPVWV